MAIKTLITVADYAALDESEDARYELSEGELVVTPSPGYFHNDMRDELNSRLRAFVKAQGLGNVISEMDFRLVGDTVRRPDVAFLSAQRLQGIDLHQIPLQVAPDLVVEIVSPSDRADDLLLKVSQYLAAGVKAVWLLYPATRLAYRYLPGRLVPEARSADQGHAFDEPELLPGLSIPLGQILE